MLYRVYKYTNKWIYVGKTKLRQLNNLVNKLDDTDYIIIINHDIKRNMDEVYYRGKAIEYNQQYRKKMKVKVKKRT